MERDAIVLVQSTDEIPDFRPQNPLHRTRLRCDNSDIELARAERRSHLKTDEAGANHDCARRRQRLGDQCATVGNSAKIMDVRQVMTGDVEPHRLGAGGKKQCLIVKSTTIRELDVAAGRVDRLHLDTKPQVDALLAIELHRPQRNKILGRAASEEVLRQIGPVAGDGQIRTEHRNAPIVAFPPKHLGRRVARGVAANDDDRPQPSCTFRRAVRRHLFACEDGATPPFDPPTGNRVESRRAERLAGAQAEAGVMPRAPDRIVNEQALLKGAIVMGADGTDGKHLFAASRKQRRFTIDVSEQHGPVGDRRERDPLNEIGPGRFAGVIAHSTYLGRWCSEPAGTWGDWLAGIRPATVPLCRSNATPPAATTFQRAAIGCATGLPTKPG